MAALRSPASIARAPPGNENPLMTETPGRRRTVLRDLLLVLLTVTTGCADAMHVAYTAYTQTLIQRGAMKGGEALEPTSTATTVRLKGGQRLVTDGPFAETKEALGGFYMIQAADLDEALELASGCPAATYGSVEVRPIWEYPTGAEA